MLRAEFHIDRVRAIVPANASTENIKQATVPHAQQLAAGMACATCGWFAGADMHAEVRVVGSQVFVDRAFCPRHAANVGTIS